MVMVGANLTELSCPSNERLLNGVDEAKPGVMPRNGAGRCRERGSCNGVRHGSGGFEAPRQLHNPGARESRHGHVEKAQQGQLRAVDDLGPK